MWKSILAELVAALAAHWETSDKVGGLLPVIVPIAEAGIVAKIAPATAPDGSLAAVVTSHNTIEDALAGIVQAVLPAAVSGAPSAEIKADAATAAVNELTQAVTDTVITEQPASGMAEAATG
jgi:formylmethanofuran:tetrahydromethanopterin formyltransferase